MQPQMNAKKRRWAYRGGTEKRSSWRRKSYVGIEGGWLDLSPLAWESSWLFRGRRLSLFLLLSLTSLLYPATRRSPQDRSSFPDSLAAAGRSPGPGAHGPRHDHGDGGHPDRRGAHAGLPAASRGPVPPEVGIPGRQGGGRRVARGLPAPRIARGAGDRGRGGAGDLPDRAPVPERLCRPAAVLSNFALWGDADESGLRADRVGAAGRPSPPPLPCCGFGIF